MSARSTDGCGDLVRVSTIDATLTQLTSRPCPSTDGCGDLVRVSTIDATLTQLTSRPCP